MYRAWKGGTQASRYLHPYLVVSPLPGSWGTLTGWQSVTVEGGRGSSCCPAVVSSAAGAETAQCAGRVQGTGWGRSDYAADWAGTARTGTELWLNPAALHRASECCRQGPSL